MNPLPYRVNKNPWMIFVNSRCVKIFPHYEQAFIWCVEMRLVNSYGRNKKCLVDGVKILQDY